MESPHQSTIKNVDQETPTTLSPASGDNKEEKKESFISEVIRFSLIALLIVLPIRMFIAQPFIVSGASMENTFSTGEYLIVDQVTYSFEAPQRGDVIVFRYPRNPSKFFIKRIIGIPGDTITIEGQGVTITNETYPEGIQLDENYVTDGIKEFNTVETLGSDEYYVMGDNRDNSSDSRTWGILPEDNIIGRAYVRLFPLTEIGFLPGSFDTTEATNSSLAE